MTDKKKPDDPYYTNSNSGCNLLLSKAVDLFIWIVRIFAAVTSEKKPKADDAVSDSAPERLSASAPTDEEDTK